MPSLSDSMALIPVWPAALVGRRVFLLSGVREMVFRQIELNGVNMVHLDKLKGRLATTNDNMVIERALLALEAELTAAPPPDCVQDPASSAPTEADRPVDPTPANPPPQHKRRLQ
jgi:hypothetical protein